MLLTLAGALDIKGEKKSQDPPVFCKLLSLVLDPVLMSGSLNLRDMICQDLDQSFSNVPA